MTADKYDTHPDESEVLPNNLALTDSDTINEEEAAGFLRAEHAAIDALDDETKFTADYLYALHRNALGHLYDFAGRLRTVNMSKGNFMFAPAHVLPQTMLTFEKELLEKINAYENENESDLLDAIAAMHAELLYIHPFREGNGRIVRLFTKLLFLAKRGEELDFGLLTEGDNKERYISAVQQASTQVYGLMKELFREMRARLD